MGKFNIFAVEEEGKREHPSLFGFLTAAIKAGCRGAMINAYPTRDDNELVVARTSKIGDIEIAKYPYEYLKATGTASDRPSSGAPMIRFQDFFTYAAASEVERNSNEGRDSDIRNVYLRLHGRGSAARMVAHLSQLWTGMSTDFVAEHLICCVDDPEELGILRKAFPHLSLVVAYGEWGRNQKTIEIGGTLDTHHAAILMEPETYRYERAKSLRRRGHEVHIQWVVGPSPAKQLEDYHGIGISTLVTTEWARLMKKGVHLPTSPSRELKQGEGATVDMPRFHIPRGTPKE